MSGGGPGRAAAPGGAAPLRRRVHVIAGYDVHADIPRGAAAAVSALPPGERHRRLAAAVVEQVDVRVPEVPAGEPLLRDGCKIKVIVLPGLWQERSENDIYSHT